MVRQASPAATSRKLADFAIATVNYWDAPYEVTEVPVNLFTSVWTLVVLVYLIFAPIASSKIANKYAILVIEVLTMILWISSFASLGSFTSKYCYFPLHEKKCNEFIATAVFGALNW